MTEDETQGGGEAGETPHDDELDVEAPNESAPGHNPPEDEQKDE